MNREEAIGRYDRIRYNLLNSDDKAAVDVAFDALMEQEEKEPCEWCFHFVNDRQYLVSQGNGMYKEAMFEFCPMCGRRLEGS